MVCSDKASSGQSNLYEIGNTDISGDVAWSQQYGTGAEHAAGKEIPDTVTIGSISANMTLSVATTDCTLPLDSDGILGLNFVSMTFSMFWISRNDCPAGQPADRNPSIRGSAYLDGCYQRPDVRACDEFVVD